MLAQQHIFIFKKCQHTLTAVVTRSALCCTILHMRISNSVADPGARFFSKNNELSY